MLSLSDDNCIKLWEIHLDNNFKILKLIKEFKIEIIEETQKIRALFFIDDEQFITGSSNGLINIF